METLLRDFFVALLSIVVMDAVFLGLLIGSFFREELGELARPSFRKLPVLATYAIMAAGFALIVAPQLASTGQAVGLGALFGLVIYGVYELTNYALVEGWPARMVPVDIAWGMFQSAAVSLIIYYLK